MRPGCPVPGCPDARFPDAMKPDFQGVRTHWNQGFMAFQPPRRTRIAMLMVLE